MKFQGARGSYTKTEVLGAGSFGNVYAARSDASGLPDVVAVKVSKEPRLESGRSTVVEALRDEVTQLRQLEGSGIAPRVLDEGEREGHPFFVMERLPGSLRSDLEKMEMGVRLAAVAALCDRVAELHELGRVHRDLKPSNVLVDAEQTPPRVLLCDFSTARLLRQTKQSTMSRVGTEDFLPPEAALRVTGDSLGPAWDVYGCGLCAWYGVVSQLPARLPVAHPPEGGWGEAVAPASVGSHVRGEAIGATDRARLREALEEAHTSAVVVEAVAELLLTGLTRALAGDPDERGSPTELAALLRAAGAALSRPVPAVERAPLLVSGRSRRSVVPLAAGGVVLFGLGLGAGAVLSGALTPLAGSSEVVEQVVEVTETQPEEVLEPEAPAVPEREERPSEPASVTPADAEEPAVPEPSVAVARTVPAPVEEGPPEEATPAADAASTEQVEEARPVSVRIQGDLPYSAYEITCPSGLRERVALVEGVGVSPPIPPEACRVALKGGPPKRVAVSAGHRIVCAEAEGVVVCDAEVQRVRDGETGDVYQVWCTNHQRIRLCEDSRRVSERARDERERGPVEIMFPRGLPITSVEVLCSGGYRRRGSVDQGRVLLSDVPRGDCRALLKGGAPAAMPVHFGDRLVCEPGEGAEESLLCHSGPSTPR